jgi:glyoxylase-like metal-dependent hydrolase (beta-lactamase superfamily II)
MLTRLCGGLAFSVFLSPFAPSPAALGQETPEYEVYAIEYGVLPDRQLSAFLPGADPSIRTDMSLMVWLLRGPDGHNILVDAGYRPDFSNTLTPSIEEYLRPDLALEKLGVSPGEISDIILTHIHWDHADGLPLFPNAHVWLQKAELEFHKARAIESSGDSTDIEPRFLRDLVELNVKGRVTLLDGDALEVFEGIRVYTGPKHTFASQYVGVNTAGGTVVVASDCAWFYANFELGLANSLTLDPEADLKAFERMKRIAARPDWILPGHDPGVFEKFPNPVEGVARIR